MQAMGYTLQETRLLAPADAAGAIYRGRLLHYRRGLIAAH